MTARNYGQNSGLVSALELVGERWALLIVRDLLVGPRRYTDLKAGLPRIPTNILSTRLKELQEGGVIRRAPLHHSVVYDLTDAGRELEQVVLALSRWGLSAAGEPADDDVITAESLTLDLRSVFQTDAATGYEPTAYGVRVGDVHLTARVDGSALDISPGASGATDADLDFAAGHGIRSVITGEVTADAAIERGIVRILSGNAALMNRFAATFTAARQTVPF
ncbi:winged helix-turn-helix transcriptional regulator [Mycetocola zhujimingii]|uniref:winged helix-turn-helix transcriptional regulator n=1 Tax=Mycetocola zhujimingii TaxID=2079792 RepID=UPI000D38D5A6|nr:winged helix-turn-helix transcriptional regulator [Mycetocola zhujimingii]AWB85535.1 transcriptional regulator [Mycetocola zhujimingii]